MSKNVLRGLEGDTEILGPREFLVTNISYGTSKAGNGFASIECVDNTGNVTYGAFMLRDSLAAPQFGTILHGSWSVSNKGSFFRGE